MITVRSPVRISLAGAGTDIPSYYRDHDGFLIAAAIDKYVAVTVIRSLAPGIHLTHSETEHASAIDLTTFIQFHRNIIPIQGRFFLSEQKFIPNPFRSSRPLRGFLYSFHLEAW